MSSAWHEKLLADARAGLGASRVLLGPAPDLVPVNDFTVLRICGLQSERDLPFAALHRLLLPVLSADELRQTLRGSPFQLRCAVHELLIGLSPVLVQADDAQWLDRETMDVLGFVARRVTGHRLAVLISGCPEWTGEQPSALVGLAAELGSPVDAAQHAWHAGRPDWARTLLSRAGADAGRTALLLGEIELRDGDPAVAVHELTTAAAQLDDPSPALLLAGEARRLCGDVRGYRAMTRTLPPISDLPISDLMLAHFRGLTATFEGRHADAAQPLRDVVRLGMAATDVASAVWAAEAAFALGLGEKAFECASAAVSRARPTGREAALPWALVQLSLAAIVLDRHEVALEASREGLAASTAQRTTRTEHLSLLALSAALRDDRETAQSHLDNAAAAIAKRGLGRPCAIASWAYACLDLADDRPADALARLDTMTAGVSGTQPAIQALATPQLVEAAVLVGQHDRAERALKVFDGWVRTGGNSAWLALSHRCHAMLTDDLTHFETAIALHRKAGAAMELARTQLLYANRLRLRRRLLDARDQFRSALRVFQSIGAQRWTARAEAGLRAAGETVSAPNVSLAGLTPQQAAISRLVAVGETNKEIARRLVISHRTVDHHLRNIFTTLGVRSRVELARRVTSLEDEQA